MKKSIRSAFVLSHMLFLTGCTAGEMQSSFGLVLLAVIVSIIWTCVQASRDAKKEEETRFAAKRIMMSSQHGANVNPNMPILIGVKGYGGIAVDEQNKKVCLIKGVGYSAHTEMFSYRDVLSSEIIEDGESVTKTVRSSQIGGALIGGLALGGVGAIIGGLTGATKSTNEVSRIALQVTVNDIRSPIHRVMLLDDVNISYKKSDPVYQDAMDYAQEWHSTIKVLIHQADEEDKLQEQQDAKNTVAVAPKVSLADELEKLGELRDKGVLTEEEFISQKTKLLAG